MTENIAMEQTVGPAPVLQARMAGLLYLVNIAGGLFAELFVRGRLMVAGDPAATAHNILAHELLYRLGFVAELIICVTNVPLAVIFLDLFRIVSRRVSSLVVFFTLVGTAIESVSLLDHYAPLLLLGAAHYPNAEAQAYVSLQLFENGFTIALVFFGFYCLSIGYLIFHSRFMPRVIGALLAIGGACYLTSSFAHFLAPAFARSLIPWILLPSGVAELSLCLWFLIVGVNADRWMAQARATEKRS